MNRKKRKYAARRWLVAVIALTSVAALAFGGYALLHPRDTEKEQLHAIGYSDSEIEAAREKLSDDQRGQLTETSYFPRMTELLAAPEFRAEQLDAYLDYLTATDTDYDMDSAVRLVNDGIRLPYSQKLAELHAQPGFLKDRAERYLAYDGKTPADIITAVNCDRDYDYYTHITPTDMDKGMLILVNKYHALDSKFVDADLVTLDSRYDNRNGGKLNRTVYEAFKKLVDDAEKDGYHIRNNSAYRSYGIQKTLYNQYKSAHGLAWAEERSARAGHSEHQTGLALDVEVAHGYQTGKRFENTKEFEWMRDHCYQYGFILRYPKGKEDLTGYMYEAWHYRYVGVEAATYIQQHGITFEEYYARFVAGQ